MPDNPPSARSSNSNSPNPDSIGRGLPRLVEFAIAGLGLLVLSPLMALCALAVILGSRGPALFRQERVGLKGKSFRLYKFRTMQPSRHGPAVTAADDKRITSVGRVLRKYKLDEFPQLWNVLKGDMSLVGPRPEVPRYVNQESEAWRFVLQARPGIADPVTVHLRNEEDLLARLNGNRENFYVQVLQPYKLLGYEDYLRRRNWLLDLKVLRDISLAVLLPNRFPPPALHDLAYTSGSETKDSPIAPAVKPLRYSGKGRFQTGLEWLRPYSRLMNRQTKYLMDTLVLSCAFCLAYLLRFDFAIPRQDVRNLSLQVLCVVAIQIGAMSATGVYSFVWRYVGLAEVRAFLKAALFSCVPVIALRLVLPDALKQFRIPLSIALADTVFAFGGVLAVRVLRRAVYEAFKRNDSVSTEGVDKKAILLIGAGRAGVFAAKEILSNGGSDLELKGFVDDDPNKQGRVIQSVRVLGTTRELPELVQELGIDHVVMSIPGATRTQFRRILEICEQIPIRVRVVPGLHDILHGRVKVSRIRDLQIEDLLGREQVQLDEQAVERFLVGKTVMVTGAGGSIGSELARNVARYQPANLLLVERAEFALFEIGRELSSGWPGISQHALVADVGDRERMRRIFATYRPNVVLHAAAHKHVPMMEHNASEAVKNNVLATQVLGDLAGRFGVEAFVLISTDKAVRPTSIMGATKRVAELVVQDLNRTYATRYLAVRFGNVIGSAGSVIPIFRQQILEGGPVTVTHPDMTRYFMTIPEASQLVLQAGAMGEGGEIFILNMGEPVRILDLAEEAISLSGLKPYEDIDIVFTGVRPGEKLFEELEIKEEQMSKTRHPKIFIGKIGTYSRDMVSEAIERFRLLALRGSTEDVRNYLNELLPEAQLGTTTRSLTGARANSKLNIRPPSNQLVARRMGGSGR